MASETGREARDGYSLVSYDDGTFGWETAGGRSKDGYRSKGAASTQGKRARASEVADLASADPGHAQIDTVLEEIRQQVSAEYLRAYEGAEEKLADYLRRFEAKDRIHAEAVRRGEETEADYREWRRGQILVGKRWQELVDTLAEDYRNADRLAASIVNGYTPEAYALNHDYATFQVEKGSRVDTSYTLYSRATVERLLRDQPDLLPRAKVDGRKGLRWNRQHIASAVTQGVLQGEDLGQVSKRIRSVADMDERAAMRTARTAMTSAQNAGRLDAYRRAAAMGIDVRKQWLATLDQRTRHSHRRLDGEVAGLDEAFSNGLMYPGDPESGRGSEVYNCRCTLVPEIDGVDQSDAPRRSRLGDMSYEEWRSYGARKAVSPSGTSYNSPLKDGQDGFRAFQYSSSRMEEGTLEGEYDKIGYNWWKDDLQDADRKVITQYKNSSVAINGQLREGILKSATATKVREIEKALDKSEVKVPFVAQRISTGDLLGIPDQPTVEQIQSLVGKVFTDRAFVSTDPVSEEDYRFYGLNNTGMSSSSVVSYHIRIPKGKGIGGLASQGTMMASEFIVNRGSQFKVLGAYIGEDGLVHCNLEWVGRDPEPLVVEKKKKKG